MKSKMLVVCLLLSMPSLKAWSQTKVDKFCSVIISMKGGFSSKTIATIHFGENDSLFSFKDTSITEKLRRVNSFSNSVDVLNYMSKIGWEFVIIAPIKLYGTDIEKIYFKKSFDSSELISNN